MGLRQFSISIKIILENNHINRAKAIFRHLIWQLRKLFNLFPVVLKISKSQIFAQHKQCGVSALINSQGMYDYNNMHLVKLLMGTFNIECAMEKSNDKLFFDIGANIGVYSLLASENNKNIVYAFEPHPTTFEYLKRNIELNNRSTVITINQAVSNENSQVYFTNEPGSPTNRMSHELDNNILVPCIRMDEFCASHNIEPNYVKIDIEGFEYNCLIGFGKYLKYIDLLLVEMNGLSDTVSVGIENIINLLCNVHSFKGPYSFDYNNLTFKTVSLERKEDGIFLSERFIPELNKYGLKII